MIHHLPAGDIINLLPTHRLLLLHLLLRSMSMSDGPGRLLYSNMICANKVIYHLLSTADGHHHRRYMRSYHIVLSRRYDVTSTGMMVMVIDIIIIIIVIITITISIIITIIIIPTTIIMIITIITILIASVLYPTCPLCLFTSAALCAYSLSNTGCRLPCSIQCCKDNDHV